MLAGVALTDQRAPQSGNLWVWPGSHLGHQALFQEQGTRSSVRSAATPSGSNRRSTRARAPS